ncbi:DNA polymerase III subunit delta [Corynebacterium argentoratense]|uniref:DNA polymerase III subunit delta n=1 Tax=Corynebacterium argentoratense TaxID=42817 RepID=UPI0028E9CF48|nr:DNA polymerase III subunit delta [Corynebacterium argentoratense]
MAERARAGIITQVRQQLPPGTDLPITLLRAGEVTLSEMYELLSPSLFAEDRVVIFTDADAAGKDPAQVLLDAAKNPPEGITLIIQHSGGGRTKNMVTPLSKLADVVRVDKVKPSERFAWLNQEFRNHGVKVTPDVVNAVLEGVGSDLRELASAAAQLVADTGGDVTVENVRQFYRGVAEVSGFDIADLACAGNTARAVASTRRALQLGLSPVLLTSALATKVGQIARMYSTARPDARELKMQPWLMDKTHKVARRWNGDSVSRAVIVIAELEAAVKGQGGDPNYVLEHAVREISELARR